MSNFVISTDWLMGFSFNFFGNTEHRVFNYKPRYYDEAAEERRRIFGSVDEHAGRRDEDGKPKEYRPGAYIQGSLRDGNYQKMRGGSKVTAAIGLISLILFFVILYYVAKFYGMLF